MTMPTRQRDIRERDFYCPELLALTERIPRTLTLWEQQRIQVLGVQAIRRYWKAVRIADGNSSAPTTHGPAPPRQ